VYSTARSRQSATDLLQAQTLDFKEVSTPDSGALKEYVRNSKMDGNPIDLLLEVLNVKGNTARFDMDDGKPFDLEVSASEIKEALFAPKMKVDFLKRFAFLFSRKPNTFPG